MAAGYPSPTNLFVPSDEATGGLIVGFSRNPRTFKINQYRTLIPVKKNVGVYWSLASQQGARLVTANDTEHVWADGADAPHGADNLESIQPLTFQTTRRAYPFTLGNITVETATVPVIQIQANVAAQQAMTAMTLLGVNALKAASWGTNTAAVTTITGNAAKHWGNGSTGVASENGPHIMDCLNYASILINQNTLGVVQPNQMCLVVNPNAARKMAQSPEVRYYIAQSPFAMAQLRGDVPNQNGQWGLPEVLYNHPVIVEDAVIIVDKKGSGTTTRSYVLDDGSAFLLSRPGDLEGIEGVMSYSTLHTYVFKDEMTAYIKNDPDNERTAGRVVANYQHVVAQPLAGFYFTNLFG